MESQILAKEAYEKQLDNLDEIRDEINGGKRVPEEATSETAPYFPDNTFTKKEGTIDTGLVIQDANENEYVWVVVPRTTAVYKTTGLGKTTFTDADALKAYSTNPLHVAVADGKVRPYTAVRSCLDYEV